MKRKSGRLMLLLGLLLLVVLLIGGYLYLTGGGGGLLGGAAKPTPTPIVKVPVIMAKQTVAKDTYITDKNLEEYFEAKEITKTKGLAADLVSDIYQLEEMVTTGEIKKDELVRQSQFVKASLSFKIDPDKRAMPLEVDRFSGVVGRMVKDDHVDVVLSGIVEEWFMQKFPLTVECQLPNACPSYSVRPFPQTAIEPFRLLTVKVLIEDIRVLDLITLTVEAAPPQGKPSQTTTPGPIAGLATSWIAILEVDEQQAEILRYAIDQNWTAQLLLRRRGDAGRQTTTGITTWILLDPQGPYRMPVPQAIPHPVDPGTLPEGIIPAYLP